ncbi:MAG: NUDIX hydrolase [Enterococcus sp.]
MEQPIFGKKENHVEYQARFGAYVVIPETPEPKARIILVQAPNGAFFLPGGEIEKEESHEEAINREMLEEVGFEVTLAGYLGEAIEYFYSSHRDTHYYHPGYFYLVQSWAKVAEPTEKTNNLSWHTPDDAMLLLKRGSHRWAVQQWLKNNG